MTTFTESIVEEATLAWFTELGYTHLRGPSIAPEEYAAERSSYSDVLLVARLRDALARLNPAIPVEGLEEAYRKLTHITSPQLLDANHELHRYLVEGVPVEYLRPDGAIAYDHVRLLDFEDARTNDFLVVDQLTVKDGRNTRRPDVVVYVNGLPLAVIELKNAADESATIWTAFQQLQTYKDELPTLFTFNALLVVSDGLEAMDGKAMIVCMSRSICVDLYGAIVKLRPQWHDDDDTKGAIKVVMTGNASEERQWQAHIRTKGRREALAKRFKDPADPLRLVIVRDMWLTGFDAPCLHTMYLDKPMRGHGLMQAIARVNRVFRDKPGGLVVDYLGLADQLKQALLTYTESGGRGNTAVDQLEAVAVMLEKHETCVALFHGFDWSLGPPPPRRSS